MIYFMQAVDGGPVKIGFTDDLPTRHYQLERNYGRPLAILATMEGGREREAEIHARFAHLRLGKKEQFRPGVDLMQFIGRPLLVGANPDAVELMESREDARRYVRLDDELCEIGRKLAAIRGTTMTELFTGILKPVVEREYGKELDREAERFKGKPKGGAK